MRLTESSHRESDTNYAECALSFRSWGWSPQLRFRLAGVTDELHCSRDQSGDTHCTPQSGCGEETSPTAGRCRDIGRSRNSFVHNNSVFDGQCQFNGSIWRRTSSWGGPSMTRAIYSSAAYAELELTRHRSRNTTIRNEDYCVQSTWIRVAKKGVSQIHRHRGHAKQGLTCAKAKSSLSAGPGWRGFRAQVPDWGAAGATQEKVNLEKRRAAERAETTCLRVHVGRSSEGWRGELTTFTLPRADTLALRQYCAL